MYIYILVGSLKYVMVGTSSDITHVVGVVSRFFANLGKKHWQAVKWILKYPKGTYRVCLYFGSVSMC